MKLCLLVACLLAACLLAACHCHMICMPATWRTPLSAKQWGSPAASLPASHISLAKVQMTAEAYVASAPTQKIMTGTVSSIFEGQG